MLDREDYGIFEGKKWVVAILSEEKIKELDEYELPYKIQKCMEKNGKKICKVMVKIADEEKVYLPALRIVLSSMIKNIEDEFEGLEED